MYFRSIGVGMDEETGYEIGGGFYAKFQRDVLCIQNAFNMFLQRKIKVSEGETLSVSFTSIPYSEDDSRNQFAPMNLHHQFDFSTYLKSDLHMRKRMIFEATRATLQRAANHYQWDWTPFEIASKQIEELNFMAIAQSRKRFRHPTRNLTMLPICQFDIESFPVFAVLYKSRPKLKQIAKIPMGEIFPTQDYYSSCLSDARWVSESEFEIQATPFYAKSASWRCTIDEEQLAE